MKTQLLIHPEELNDAWIDRAVALGIDVLGLHPVGGSSAKDSLDALLEKLKEPDFRALLDKVADAGITIEYELHAGSWLAPRELFAEHPDYFRMDDTGVRTDHRNFCPSSQEMLDIVADNAARLAKQLYRSSHRYYFWLDDTKNGGCHCEQCRKLSLSDQQMLVMNRILSGLRRVDPEAQLAYLAYFQCIEPPKTVLPDKGIFLEYAPFEKNTAVRVSEQSVGAELEQLFRVFPASEAKILEYWYDNSLFSNWKKPPKRFSPDNDLIRDDLAFYAARGVPYIASFACYLGEDYTSLYGEPDLSAFAKA